MRLRITRYKCRSLANLGDTKNYLPLRQYAKVNHLHESTVRERIAKGRLIGYKIGGKWYVKK